MIRATDLNVCLSEHPTQYSVSGRKSSLACGISLPQSMQLHMIGPHTLPFPSIPNRIAVFGRPSLWALVRVAFTNCSNLRNRDFHFITHNGILTMRQKPVKRKVQLFFRGILRLHLSKKFLYLFLVFFRQFILI